MTHKTSILCDRCETEMVTHSSYPHNYGLKLSVIDTNINDTAIEYAVMQYPPLNEAKHFCCKACLKEWVNANE